MRLGAVKLADFDALRRANRLWPGFCDLAGLTDPMRNVRDASLLGIVALADRHPEEVRAFLTRRDFSSTAESVLAYLDEQQDNPKRLAAVRSFVTMASV